MKFISSVLFAGLLSVAVGCGSSGAGVDNGPNNPEVMDPGGMMDGVDYPKGNYGNSVGQQIGNLSFLWHKNGLADVGQAPTKVTLADIYALRKSGARMLALSGAAEWCPPCQDEAKALGRVLKAQEFKDYLQSKGNPLVVVQVVLQKQDGSPSDIETMEKWIGAYNIDSFSVGIDPKDQVGQYTTNFLPRNLYIRISDMTILGSEPGAPSMDAALITKLKGYIERVAN
jgi:thiol-disulfide isomerase/thioredoxin